MEPFLWTMTDAWNVHANLWKINQSWILKVPLADAIQPCIWSHLSFLSICQLTRWFMKGNMQHVEMNKWHNLRYLAPQRKWFKFLLSKLTVSVLTKCLGCLTTRWSLPWETYNLNGLIADTSCCKLFVTSIKSWIPGIWTFPWKSDKTLITSSTQNNLMTWEPL